MAELGLPFQGDAWYVEQVAYATKPDDTNTGLPISCKILDMRYGIGDKHKVLRGFDAPNACSLLEQCSDFTLHLEYIPQCDDTLLSDIVNRTGDMRMKPLGFVLRTNRFLNVTDDRTTYLIWGCKPKTVRIAASINNEYIVTVDFSAKQAESHASDSGGWMPVKPSPLTGAYLAFNVAGSIRRSATPGAACDTELAYIADSIDITIDHNIVDKFDHDSVIKQYAIEGAYDITGTVDISLDEGGREHVNEILDQTVFDVEIRMGAVGCPMICISDCQWKSGEVDVNISGDVLADSAPFTGHPTDGNLKRIIRAAA